MQGPLVLRLSLGLRGARRVDCVELTVELRLRVSQVRRPIASGQFTLGGLPDLDHEVQRMKFVPAVMQ